MTLVHRLDRLDNKADQILHRTGTMLAAKLRTVATNFIMNPVEIRINYGTVYFANCLQIGNQMSFHATFFAKRQAGRPTRRMLDTTRAFREFGFRARTDFREGLARTIAWYQNQ